MVTFSIPGDNELADAAKSTPRPRPPLPFAKRAYVSSPFASKRLGTPQSAPARKLLTRDEIPSSSLNPSSIATARNIFRASSINDSPPTGSFSPSIPNSTMKRVFAPGATPEPGLSFRESTAKVAPRGMAAKVSSKDLFTMRIEEPDLELSGEALTRKIPKEWNSKGSIYADQFLAHLCPSEFDDEQRRQFFCILDLRRLKFAANEIFSKKDWKLNVINFAKEFEKSRSIILLRYGLYEFQNVKPSKEVLKRWRRDHGLPEPDAEDDAEPTPTKPATSKKRKADDEISKDVDAGGNKRRARDEEEPRPAEAPAAASTLKANKRKASVSEESEPQPFKMQKSTPSAAKSLFEKIANKTSTTPAGSPVKAPTKPVDDSPAPKPNLFAQKKTNGGSLQKSVFQNLKPGSAQPSGNIFGYLSDASSAKNSGVDADGESESDSEANNSQATGQSEEQSAAASGADTASQVGSGLFAAKKPAPTSAVAAPATLSAPGTRESTPGLSLFDRVTTGSDGQPVRAAEDKPDAAGSDEPASKPSDLTWNPSSTPLKFAPSTAPAPAPASSLFGNAAPSSAASLFGAKPAATSNLFGAPKQDAPAAPDRSSTPATEQTDKTGGESDKENDEAPNKKSLSETKAPAAGPSLFQTKPAGEASKEAEPAKPASTLFGAPKADDKPAASSAASIFGAVAKPTEAPAATPVLQSSTLFGAKPTEAEKPAATEPPKFSFGAPSGTSTPSEAAPTSTLFGAKPAATSNLFGNASSTPATSNLFGASSSAAKADEPATKKPAFSFGQPGNANGVSEPTKPLFAPKSPSSTAPAFDGSPMKQDGPSPAKKAFGSGSTAPATSSPLFSFGAGASAAPSSAPMFGAASAAPANGTNSTGAIFSGVTPAASSGSGGFNFAFGQNSSASSGATGNNPFASGNTGANSGGNSGSTSGGMFSFGGASAAPAASGSPFQFGGASSTPAPVFGGNQTSNAAPAFGTAPASTAPPSFSFQGATSQPSQNGGFNFGSNQAAPSFLQPPVGGTSTTGTNTPFSLGGGSSLATTPAGGTPEPSAQTEAATGDQDEEGGEKSEPVNLTEGFEKDEEILHEVRAKVLKFIRLEDLPEDKPKPKSPWSAQGVGSIKMLKHKETNKVRLLMRAEPRGHVAINRLVLPQIDYAADKKYVKVMTANEKGDGLETWMIQVKTTDLAKELAEALEKHKKLNEKAKEEKA